MNALGRAFVAAVCAAGIMASVLQAAALAPATIYVVDQKHPKASDAGPGTKEAPFKTIGKGASVAKAGDTLLIGTGTYRERFVIKNSGAKDKPITVKTAPGQRVIINGAGVKGNFIVSRAAKAGYIKIDGLELRDADTGSGSGMGLQRLRRGLDHRHAGLSSRRF